MSHIHKILKFLFEKHFNNIHFNNFANNMYSFFNRFFPSPHDFQAAEIADEGLP